MKRPFLWWTDWARSVGLVPTCGLILASSLSACTVRGSRSGDAAKAPLRAEASPRSNATSTACADGSPPRWSVQVIASQGRFASSEPRSAQRDVNLIWAEQRPARKQLSVRGDWVELPPAAPSEAVGRVAVEFAGASGSLRTPAVPEDVSYAKVHAGPEGTLVVSARNGLYLYRKQRETWSKLAAADYSEAQFLAFNDGSLLAFAALWLEVWDTASGVLRQRTYPKLKHGERVIKLDERRVAVLGTGAATVAQLWSRGCEASANSGGWRWSLPSYLTPSPHLGAAVTAGSSVRLSDGRLLSTRAVIDAKAQRLQLAPSSKAFPNQPLERFGSQLVLLKSGQALLVSGWFGAQRAPESEARAPRYDRAAPTLLLDPDSFELHASGELVAPRWQHSATVLRDGSVLVAGGVNAERLTPRLEHWTPESAAWSSAGTLRLPRVAHTATLLSDDSVLLVGSCPAQVSRLSGDRKPAVLTTTTAAARAERINVPAAEQDAGVLAHARCGHVAQAMADDGVLVAGGFASPQALVELGVVEGSSPLDSVEMWNAKTRSWSPGPPMNEPRAGAASTTLTDGRIVVLGGQDSLSSAWPSIETYDPKTGQWQVVGILPRHCTSASVFQVADYRLLAFLDQDIFELEIDDAKGARWWQLPLASPVP